MIQHPILLLLCGVSVLVVALAVLCAPQPAAPQRRWPADDELGSDPLPEPNPHVRAIAERIYDGTERGVIQWEDDGWRIAVPSTPREVSEALDQMAEGIVQRREEERLNRDIFDRGWG